MDGFALTWATTAHSGEYVQKNHGLIPGLYQIETGHPFKGYFVATLEAVTLAGGVYAWVIVSHHERGRDKWRVRYLALTTSDVSKFDRAFNEAIKHEDWAKN